MKGFDNTIDKLMVFASDIDRKRHGSVIAEELHGMRFSSHKGHCDKCGGRDVLVLDVASGNGVFLQDVVVAAGALAGGKFGLNLKDVAGVDNKKRHLLPGGKFRPERLKALCDAARDKGDGVVGLLRPWQASREKVPS